MLPVLCLFRSFQVSQLSEQSELVLMGRQLVLLVWLMVNSQAAVRHLLGLYHTTLLMLVHTLVVAMAQCRQDQCRITLHRVAVMLGITGRRRFMQAILPTMMFLIGTAVSYQHHNDKQILCIPMMFKSMTTHHVIFYVTLVLFLCWFSFLSRFMDWYCACAVITMLVVFCRKMCV